MGPTSGSDGDDEELTCSNMGMTWPDTKGTGLDLAQCMCRVVPGRPVGYSKFRPARLSLYGPD
jgi:hypothetical protein